MRLCHLERYEQPVPYPAALQRQRDLAQQVLDGTSPDTLLLLEHPPTVTITRSTHQDEIKADDDALAARGIAIAHTDRGGRSTYHGPGQLVGYPILDLRHHGQDLHRYLRGLEAALIAALAEMGIRAITIPGLTGVWVDGRKIAAIGIKARQWVTMHGFSLNIDMELTPMRTDLVPCGLYGRDVTSIAEILGVPAVDRRRVEDAVLAGLSNALDLMFVPAPGSTDAKSPPMSRSEVVYSGL
jgi:lipoate-protein ligase B